MKSKRPLRLSVLLIAAMAFPGCNEDAAPVELNPSSLTEAQRSLQQIDQLYESDPAAALDAGQRLRPKLDELNHLITRVETSPNHYVEFYDLQPGGILLAERGPAGDGRILSESGIADHSAVELYRQLTGGATPPEALVKAERLVTPPDDAHVLARDEADPNLKSSGAFALDRGAQRGDGLASVTQSLGSGDGVVFRDQYCFKAGDFFNCLPNITGDTWASANSKSSFTRLAPYRGSMRMQVSYDNAVKGAWATFAGEEWSFRQLSGTYYPCPVWQACGTQEYYLRTHRWDVLDAAGDGYHFSYAFRSSCSWIGCDNPP
ncbi:hypothetical protein [Corallococcus exiguus]|uniref:hypothetical protein n=1 Tax=Corallococcus exiguus TaxID=83462 RepID=UPI0014722280|nr:hypothetical protein [Corallococcus exiguus]NNB87604.1 hypothetical protein [Corallococcus exiguus]